MTKKVLIVLLLVAMMIVLCGCEDSSDNPLATKASDTKAYIKINEKNIVVDVESYMYGSNGVAIIYGMDGKTYKTHSMNVVLVKEGDVNEQLE